MSANLLRPHHEFITTFVISIFIFCQQPGYAQQAFVAAGGDATGSGGTVSFSAGQVVYTTITSGSGSVSQGVQQVYDNSVLPVTLISFTATVVKDRVQLKWETTMEHNNDFFTIERSSDAIHFDEVTRVEAVGNSTSASKYKWTDEAAIAGTSYYRLKQTDFDLTSAYSRMIAVTISSLSGTIVYPNPAEDLLTVRDEIKQNTARSYQIFDTSGRIVEEKKPLGAQRMIDLTQLLPATYIIRLDNNIEVKEFKIIKK